MRQDKVDHRALKTAYAAVRMTDGLMRGSVGLVIQTPNLLAVR
jgi:hypothetical protein